MPATASGHKTGERTWSTWPKPQMKAQMMATKRATAEAVRAAQTIRAWLSVGEGKLMLRRFPRRLCSRCLPQLFRFIGGGTNRVDKSASHATFLQFMEAFDAGATRTRDHVLESARMHS